MNTLRKELLEHVIQTLEDNSGNSIEMEELHFHAFNEDYYIIGSYQAEEWLKKHGISAFEAIGDVLEYEEDVIGEIILQASDINSEKIVNYYVYIKGEEIINEFDLEQTQDELLIDLNMALKEL